MDRLIQNLQKMEQIEQRTTSIEMFRKSLNTANDVKTIHLFCTW